MRQQLIHDIVVQLEDDESKEASPQQLPLLLVSQLEDDSSFEQSEQLSPDQLALLKSLDKMEQRQQQLIQRVSQLEQDDSLDHQLLLEPPKGNGFNIYTRDIFLLHKILLVPFSIIFTFPSVLV